MGEYIIYYRGKVVGGIFDDRFLVKPRDVNVILFMAVVVFSCFGVVTLTILSSRVTIYCFLNKVKRRATALAGRRAAT